MLAGLGVRADLSGGERFVESLDDLVVEVVEDLYVRKFADPSGSGRPEIDPAQARAIAREAVRDPLARLEPVIAPAESPAGMRRRLAEAVRGELARRKALRGVRSYDDLQLDLAAVLSDPVLGPDARRRLRARFPVVLIDEFQDTDPVQWQIVEHAFVGQVSLVLIGDPKQAIYGFRGADVTAYLNAVESADRVDTLERNWRSEPELLRALDALFGPCTFGDPRIAYRVVQAASARRLLRGAVPAAPVRLRLLPRGERGSLTAKGLLRVEQVRPRIAADVADDIVSLLLSGAEIGDPGPGGPHFAPVQPGDVAVLVRTNSQADLVRAALSSRGVPAVIGGASSVFTAPVCREWLILLEALEQPHRSDRVRAAALTCFVGWSATQLGLAPDPEVDALSSLVRGWASVLAGRGVAALLETITSAQQLPSRVLSAPDGERRLTDLRHIGEALHAAASSEGLGVTALLAWLRRRMEEADEAPDGLAERSRRLDSDADAVQVVTVHRSKGLEFPVVYVPFAWDQYSPDVIERPRYHDASGQRVIDVGFGMGGSDPAAFNEGVHRHRVEEAGEQLRLLYVALTRARSQVVLWWAPATTAECAPLTRVLFGRETQATGETESGEPQLTVRVPGDDDARAVAERLSARAAGQLAAEVVKPQPVRRWEGAPRETGDLRAARFTRELDLIWRRTSYSGLTAQAHDSAAGFVSDADAPVTSEPEEGTLDDERAQLAALLPGGVGAPGSAAQVVSPMAELPGGASFGSLVHAVFETVAPEAADLDAEIALRVTEQLERWSPGAGPAVEPEALAAALRTVYESPLGPLAGGRLLREIATANRLPELSFELPLAGGDQAAGEELTLGALTPLMRRHLAGPGDPLAGYADRFEHPLLRGQSLRGFLSGSLDAVLRVGADGDPDDPLRYLIVDYKTNWLSPAPAGSGQLTAAHYAPDLLAEAMIESDYPLQALLYSVALHRYLRWRQPGYDPGVHLGGALYLFVRGMCGPQTPLIAGQPCGVFAWRPAPGLVTGLSDALDAGRVTP